MERSSQQIIDIKGLAFDRGAHLLINHALSDIPTGARLGIRGDHPELAIHLRVWCRNQGHDVVLNDSETDRTFIGSIIRGNAASARWNGAERAGFPDPAGSGSVAENPLSRWGLAARGAMVEQGGPEFHFPLDTKAEIWADNLPRLYAQAAAAQWDPSTAIDWDQPFALPAEIESAVVQIMTFLIENENAALVVPAKFLAQVHPHFREVQQVLAIQIADEARHIEVFTRRALLRSNELGLSSVSGRVSLKTLLDEPDFTLASFLLSVLGEGSFLNLLFFLDQFAPDPVTRQVARLAGQDEARHVAFGMGHLLYQISIDPATRPRLAAAIERRHDALSQTSGLNEDVFDALVLLAAGSWTPEAIGEGYSKVQQLKEEMHSGRRSRLVKLGFSMEEATALSSLHTKNFM